MIGGPALSLELVPHCFHWAARHDLKVGVADQRIGSPRIVGIIQAFAIVGQRAAERAVQRIAHHHCLPRQHRVRRGRRLAQGHADVSPTLEEHGRIGGELQIRLSHTTHGGGGSAG